MSNQMEPRRSWVRIVVTYIVVSAWTAFNGYGLFETVQAGDWDRAMEILNTYGTVTGILVAFWFGARQQKPTTEVSPDA